MPRLELNLDDQLMNDVTAEALKRRISSEALGVEALKRFVYSDAEESSAESSGYERHLGAAMKRVQALKPGTKFSLNGNHKDSVRLFTRDEWEAMKNQDGFAPHVFGREFLKYVANHGDLIELSDKGADNKQRYIRV